MLIASDSCSSRVGSMFGIGSGSTSSSLCPVRVCAAFVSNSARRGHLKVHPMAAHVDAERRDAVRDDARREQREEALAVVPVHEHVQAAEDGRRRSHHRAPLRK